MRLLKLVPDNTNIDFMRWRNVALVLSIIVTVASLAIVGIRGLNLGVDFVGGQMIRTTFPTAINVEKILQVIEPLGVLKDVHDYCNTVKVVIVGQDPYHGEGQAHGLCFSVPRGCRIPPSLRNVYKELASDLGIPPAGHGDLTHWAEQGVLLLNTALTVEAGKAGSHAGKGWDALTDAALRAVAERAEPSVFILWGNHARAKAARIPGLGPGTRHCILSAAHPSPLSAHAGFFGSRPFSQANAFLDRVGRGAIDWRVDPS